MGGRYLSQEFCLKKIINQWN